MKTIFIATYDGYNLAIVNLIVALKERRHVVDVFCHHNVNHQLKIFKDYSIQVNNVKYISEDLLNEYDVIFANNSLLRGLNLLDIKKYVFTISDNVFHESRPASDFVFSNSEKWKETTSAFCEKNCVIMESGYLKLNKSMVDKYDDDKTILFIDSGNLPYGIVGMRELAKLLCQVCERYPDYKLIIKPRILPKFATDRDYIHIYNAIDEVCNGVVPKNMIMLMENIQLGKILQKCTTVLCLYTTAYLEAALYNKNLIIIDGLPNEEYLDVRKQTFIEPVKNILVPSGCLIYYKEIFNYLPNGIKCSETHINNEVYQKGYIADAVAEIVEDIYDRYISKGKFPLIGTYQCDTYKNIMQEDASLCFNKLIQTRIENSIRNDIGGLKRKLSCADGKFDGEIERIIMEEKKNGVLIKANYNLLFNKIIKIFIDRQNELSDDYLTQSYIIYCKLVLKQIREVADMDVPEKCMNLKFYAKGLLHFQNGEVDEAIYCFEKFSQITESNKFSITVANTLMDRVYTALFICFMCNNILRDDILKKIDQSFNRELAISVINGNISPQNAVYMLSRSMTHVI